MARRASRRLERRTVVAFVVGMSVVVAVAKKWLPLSCGRLISSCRAEAWSPSRDRPRRGESPVAVMRDMGGAVALLEEQVRELRAALEEAEEAICRVDSEGRVVSANRACTVLTGYDADEIGGKSWEDIVAADDRAFVRADVRAARGKVERDVRGVRKDGSEFEMHLAVVPILDGRERPGDGRERPGDGRERPGDGRERPGDGRERHG